MKHIDLLMERYPSLESAKDDIVISYCERIGTVIVPE